MDSVEAGGWGGVSPHVDMKKRIHKRYRTLQSASPDGAVLSKLHQLDSDVSKPRPTNFYLYFPSRQNAELARIELLDSGFSVEIQKSAKGQDWLCLASKELVPGLTVLTSLRKRFSDLARRLGGEYDGWETEVYLEETARTADKSLPSNDIFHNPKDT